MAIVSPTDVSSVFKGVKHVVYQFVSCCIQIYPNDKKVKPVLDNKFQTSQADTP